MLIRYRVDCSNSSKEEIERMVTALDRIAETGSQWIPGSQSYEFELRKKEELSLVPIPDNANLSIIS